MATYQSTVLIVDDNFSAREVMRGLLTGQNYNLAFAENGSQALHMAATINPDLILLDVMMPDMDGYEVCRILRANPRLAEVPIIMVTALDDRASSLEGLNAGADDFISKPFDHLELQARVRTITQLNRYRRLQVERAKFEWVIEHSDEGYVQVNRIGQISYLNKQARLYLSLPEDDTEPPEELFQTIVARQYQPQPAEAWDTWLSTVESGLLYLVRPESTTAQAFWLQADKFAPPLELDTGHIIRLRDVTQSMSQQRDLRAFHAIIAHKLRTPLNGLSNSLQLLSDELQTSANESMLELASIASRTASRLHSEIIDILQYTQVSSFTQAENTFDMSQLAALLAQICKSLKIETIALHVDDAVAEEAVTMAPKGTELVLREVLENSKKFHPAQTPAISVTVTLHDSEHISIKLSDNGISLSPEQLANMWLPYYQGEKYFTGQIQGMGLGLSLVATLIWSVGGICKAYNRADETGLTIELLLPKAKPITFEEHF